ncbi:MAG: hydantoinase/oxoprolinase family protein [Deltaproteobacteria bacterium]|nr:hydantoinase/oxoprolinase family protein [Deltaproteobacteria bacterium]MBI3388259.1 hydantoinase/oxoprolinase family protein [Deltaproteobacteria bacterium]
MSYRIGIDVGGTFTDFVLVGRDGALRLSKSPTTPRDQSQGVIAGISELARGEHLSLGELLHDTAVIVHGTTTADNTLIEMSGAVTGLITTQGHRDEIELRRGFKEDIWDPALPPPPPIAQRRRRIGVPERLDYEGKVLVPLDETAVRTALRRLKQLGTESLAVVFMFSFINPAHERRVREIAREECPGVSISLSHEVMPSAPEFERTSTTLVNAYVAPKIERYLGRLVERLRDEGYRHDLLVMQSNGGIMTPDYITSRPVTVLSSGPTGGVIAACAVARAAKTNDFVCADMGGTSYDVCLIRGGQPEIKAGWNWHHRYLVGLPMVDVQSIGAGGGSIASVVAGSLQVGPKSAGAEPGPMCYDRGGTAPTVTDANLLLGYLNAADFCGGTMRLKTDGVRDAMAEQIGRPLGLDAVQAAHGIYRLVNANMANAIRRISATRGVDPRGLTMVVYGGNGPVHATAQAEELGIKTVLVPKTSPAFSALGLLLSDHVIDELRAYITPVGRAELDRINHLFSEMEAAARAVLAARHGARGRIELRRFANLCYPGQTFDIAVPIAARNGRLSARDVSGTVERFHALHEELHTYASRDEEPILRSVRLTAVGVTDKPAIPTLGRSFVRPSVKGRRKAFFGGRFVVTPVYDGPQLRAGQHIKGPAIIEEPFTTIVLHPKQVATLDRLGNYRIEM